MARDAIARLDDVNKNSVKREPDKSLIRFEANTGRSINLKKLHEELQKTRLAGKTGSVVHYLEVKATGKVEAAGGDLVLHVTGTKEEFQLGTQEELTPKPTKTLADLADALKRGQTIVSVTGRVQGWSGRYPAVLEKFPPGQAPATARRVLIVTDFQTAPK